MDTPQAKSDATSYLSISEAENHYKELQSYFKWLVTMTLTALGITATVGLFFFYKDMSQVRSEATDEIRRTRESLNSEISKIRGDASSIARAEALLLLTD